MTDRKQREALWLFRERVYWEGFDRRRDALFDLLDALLVTGLVPSFVHLSLSALCQRGWGSAYEALADGRLDAPWLRRLGREVPLEGPRWTRWTPASGRAVTPSAAPSAASITMSRHSAGQPIVAGWSYSWLAQLSLSRDSWPAPLDVRRVPAADNPHSVAVAQIRDHAGGLPTDVVPTYVFDAGYDPVRLARALGEWDGERGAVLVRLRRDRCFYADPPVPDGPKVGRPGRQGAQFACRDQATWPTPTAHYAAQ
jgi:hypothetical protein